VRSVERGYLMSLDQAWALSRVWYGDRLSPEFRRPTTEEARAIFRKIGLVGPFWQL
jgi:hypothetical protein